MNIFYFLLILSTLQITVHHTQSTCPLAQNTSIKHKCKCGIKTDGQIYIYCARKALTQIPTFTRNSILYDELILSGNQIKQIKNNSFNALKVKSLYLDKNNVNTIEPGAFIEIANYLEDLTLDVDSNLYLAEPPQSIFNNLLNLKTLKLNGFNIFKLNSFLFNKTRKLEHLELNNCNINELDGHTFDGLELSLKVLDLNENSIENVNYFLNVQLSKLKRLQVLRLSHNRIKILQNLNLFPRSFDVTTAQTRVSNLTVDLSFNEIYKIDENLFEPQIASQIIKLYLTNNDLSLQNELNFVRNLRNLHELYLDYNRIEYLNVNIMRSLNSLEVLSLKGNFLRDLTFSVALVNLKKLNLASNKLVKVDLRSCNGLKELNLDKNFLDNQQIPSLSGLVNLEILKLSSNSLTTFQLDELNAFRAYLNLTFLELDANQLKRIPYFLNLNKSLVTLSLSSNQLCDVNLSNMRKFYFNLKNFNLNANTPGVKCSCGIVEYFTKNLNIDNLSQICGNGRTDECSNEYGGLGQSQSCDEIDYDLEFNGFDVVRATMPTTTSTTTTTTTTTRVISQANRFGVDMDTGSGSGLSETVQTDDDTTNSFIRGHLLYNADPYQPMLQNTNLQTEQSFLTKQTILGSLIGALLLLLVLFCILICVKMRKTSGSTATTTASTTLMTLPKHNSDLIKQNILYIRPTSSTNGTATNTNTLGGDPYFQYTIGTAGNHQIPIYIASSNTSKSAYECYLGNNGTKKSRFSSFLMKLFKRGRNKSELQFIQAPAIVPQQITLQAQPFLIQQLNKTLNNSSNSSHDTTNTTSTTSSQNGGGSGCAFICTPILSRATQQQQSEQHMYHEICDTLLSKKSSFNSNDLNYLNGNFFIMNTNSNRVNTTTATNQQNSNELFI